jgi:predicted neutral ceramidase superfamily lipid hydrolase
MPEEDKKERVDRELIELLNELRVALPGVQVLFAFLLTVPFQGRFQAITGLQRDVYIVSFLCAALATALLIAPSSYHRLRFRHRDKERLLFTSNRLVIAGMAFVALAMTGVVFVVTDIIFGVPVASAITAGTTAWFVWFWYGLPLSRWLQDRQTEEKGLRPAP